MPTCSGYNAANAAISPTVIVTYTVSNSVTTITSIISTNTQTGTQALFTLDLIKTQVAAGITFTAIAANAAQNCILLSRIVFPTTITSIGVGAFSGCINLDVVTLPTGITTLADNMFSGCTSLSTVSLPNTITVLGAGSFNQCQNITTLVLPNRLTKIEASAFASCSKLTTITIPATVTEIDSSVFANCTLLTKIYFLGPPPTVCNCDTSFSNDTQPMTGYVLARYQVPTYSNGYPATGSTWYGLTMAINPNVLCVTKGTRVLTPSGYRLVEELSKKDWVTTPDGRNVPIKYIKHTKHYDVSHIEAPYLVPANALGDGIPLHDVRLSADHLIHIGNDFWIDPRRMAKRAKAVVQYGIGEDIDYYSIMTPDYFKDDIVIEDGVVVEAYGPRDTIYDKEANAYRRRPKRED